MDTATALHNHGPRDGLVGTAILDAHKDEIAEWIKTEDASAGDVAKRFVVTRNTVIGWAARRGVTLSRRNRGGNKNWKMYPPGSQKKAGRLSAAVRHMGNKVTNIRKKRATRLARLPSEVTEPKPKIDIISLTSSKFPIPLGGIGIPYADSRADECQRPLWDDSVSVGNVCGHPTKEGSRYCENCHNVLWTPVTKPVREGKRSTNSRLDFYKQVDFA